MPEQAQFEVYPQIHQLDHPDLQPEPTGEYGWRFRAANGQISAVSGEGFTRREDARRAVLEFMSAAIDATAGSAPPNAGAPLQVEIVDVEEEVARDNQIRVRVSDAEKEAIIKRAGVSGMSASEYLRGLGLGEVEGDGLASYRAGSRRPKEEVGGNAKTARPPVPPPAEKTAVSSTEANGETREEFIERRAAQLHRRYPLPAARRAAAEEWDGR